MFTYESPQMPLYQDSCILPSNLVSLHLNFINPYLKLFVMVTDFNLGVSLQSLLQLSKIIIQSFQFDLKFLFEHSLIDSTLLIENNYR